MEIVSAKRDDFGIVRKITGSTIKSIYPGTSMIENSEQITCFIIRMI